MENYSQALLIFPFRLDPREDVIHAWYMDDMMRTRGFLITMSQRSLCLLTSLPEICYCIVGSGLMLFIDWILLFCFPTTVAKYILLTFLV
ncbi:hypothetical protein MTR67_015601 [Solanum verrucosum]|uniref:Uncharacterized protein n=1 Tax=Solanum verrucosum TaxID=315347 RepID=A0AAF0QFB5_SOLVR|nr:hypothetical protein MTR67_015601 [Solanum verrucosum]